MQMSNTTKYLCRPILCCHPWSSCLSTSGMHNIDSLFMSIRGVIHPYRGDPGRVCYGRSTHRLSRQKNEIWLMMKAEWLSTAGLTRHYASCWCLTYNICIILIKSTYQHFVRPQKRPNHVIRPKDTRFYDM